MTLLIIHNEKITKVSLVKWFTLTSSGDLIIMEQYGCYHYVPKEKYDYFTADEEDDD